MKNSMVEQILALVEENRTLRCCAEGSRREAEALAKELERVFEYGAAWDPEFKTKFYRARASASTWVFGQVVSKAVENFKYPTLDVERFECEGPPETEEVPSELERTERLKRAIQEGYDAAAKRQGQESSDSILKVQKEIDAAMRADHWRRKEDS